MSFLSQNALDKGLDYLTMNGKRLDICSQEPTTYAEATSVYTLGSKIDASVGAAQEGDMSGRKVTVAAVTNGSVTATGTATHWALSDGVGELLAARTLDSSTPVTSGDKWVTPEYDIEFPDPA